jgi:hypothetical protein
MATIWTWVVDVILPLPFLLLTLILAPLPPPLRASIIGASNKVLSYPTLLKMPMLHAMLMISVGCLAFTISDLLNISSTPPAPGTVPSSTLTSMYARKWRAERNFWISAAAAYLWVVLALVRNLVADNVSLQLREHNQRHTKGHREASKARAQRNGGPHDPQAMPPTSPPYATEAAAKRYD